MSGPLVSVAMATFNGARFLREQLDTIFAQSWPNLEVTVSDDRSDDETVSILEEYRERHGLLFSVAPERLGLVRNFERAIGLCRGDLIALADQDDLWKPHKLEELVKGLEPDFSLCYCDSREYLTEDGSIVAEEEYESIREWARTHGTGRVTKRLLAENWVVSHGMLFRREVARHALPIPPNQPFHDAWLALVASRLGGGIRHVDESLQIYRLHRWSYTYRGDEHRPPTPLRRLLGGELGRSWRARCRAEIARLGDARGLELLTPDEGRFLEHLLRYYCSGLSGSPDLRAAAIGLRIAPYISTNHGRGGRTRMALKGLLGGTLAALRL